MNLDSFLLCRRPVLDLKEELVGYALSLQPTSEEVDETQAEVRAASLICAVYAEFGLSQALGENSAFIQTDLAFIHDDAIEALPPDSVILELVLDSVPDAATLERCRTLRERRYRLALNNYTGLDERSTPLLSLLSVVKIDTRRMDDAHLAKLAGSLARLPLKLLAEGVDSRQKMQYCSKVGFKLFQGDYFTHNEQVRGRRLSPSQTMLIQLINLAGSDAETTRIEEGFKHEPALALHLLRIVNTVGFGFPQRITSLRHAIAILGRRQLQRWLQLLLLASTGKVANLQRSPLLQVAALRGRMMEILVGQLQQRHRQLADQAFITGIMSMLPLALGMPMEEIFAQITLDAAIMQALKTREGILGKVLALIVCFDEEDSAGCNALLGEEILAGINHAALNSSLADALRWINSWNA